MVVGLGVVGASVTIEGDSWKEITVVIDSSLTAVLIT